ncbi:MAG: FISUMP domain-containing protein [Bacteroidales bacterium]|jgi:uncharacterized protein (TIGR02145 family)|nr:FISUMP domain-containing protein [Bacteroidales bacterium]
MKTSLLKSGKSFILFLCFCVFAHACNKDEENGSGPDNNGTSNDLCPESFTYEGKTYHGVMIGEQCWMKENLDFETGSSWCYGDNPANCETFGRLYNWETIMNGAVSSVAVPSGVRGICPEGWHVPSDREWMILEGTADSESPVGSGIWLALHYRGHDVGKNLKSKTGWEEANGTDKFGFSAVPAGFRNFEFVYHCAGQQTCFWTSTENSNEDALLRTLSYADDNSGRWYWPKTNGFSLRCVKD